jgi:hypothetical protein
MQATTTEIVRLVSDNSPEMPTNLPALLFGAMADIAVPIVTHYRSDLYHDAMYLRETVSPTCWFYWVVRPYGTHIGICAQAWVGNPSLRAKEDVCY